MRNVVRHTAGKCNSPGIPDWMQWHGQNVQKDTSKRQFRDETDLCSKTWSFQSSFKIYAVQKGKLKKHTVKVTDVVVEGSGAGLAKPAAT